MSHAAAVIPRIRVFDGLPGEIRNVRRFVSRAIDGCPDADDVTLLASELATNAVRHTASGKSATFSVSVLAEGVRVRVEVHDLGSPANPAIRQPEAPGESGAGLALVEAIADRWGFHGSRQGRVVWFEIGTDRPGPRGRRLPVTRYRCSCAFVTNNADDFGEHLAITFVADDDTGMDDQQHFELTDEAARRAGGFQLAHACACGFAADDLATLDDHLLRVFLTPESIGADGRAHGLAGFEASGA